MKTPIFLILIALNVNTITCWQNSSYIQKTDKEILNINSMKFDRIANANTHESTEGGIAKYYFKKNNVVKIYSVSYGETGKSIDEFYYTDTNLCCHVYTVYMYYHNSYKIKSKFSSRVYIEHNKVVFIMPIKKSIYFNSMDYSGNSLVKSANLLSYIINKK